jgi:hypothetical protein
MIPMHLEGAKMFEPPEKLKQICHNWGVSDVQFVDDAIKCVRSFRSDSNIFINIRGTTWDAMILPPWCCKTYPEAIVMRMLHEIGHIARKHQGDPNLRSTTNGLILSKQDSSFESFLKGDEGEAWRFALEIRKKQRPLFIELVDLFEHWTGTHVFENKCWDDNASHMWKRKVGMPLRKTVVELPRWVKSEFNEFLPARLPYKIKII